MSQNVYRAVVAFESCGKITYMFGYAESANWAMDYGRYSTTVEWASPPKTQTRYPTDADFDAARELLPAQAALTG